MEKTRLGTDGFLSDEIVDVRRRIADSYSYWMVAVRQINRLAVTTNYELKFNSLDYRSIVAAALYARTLENVQSAVLLLEIGMRRQCDASLRVALESLCILGAIVKSPDYWKEYVKADAPARRKLANKMHQWLSIDPTTIVTKDEINRLREIAEQDIAANNAKEQNAYEAAEKAGLLAWYLTAYPVLSGPVHSSIRDIESEHILFDSNERVTGLKDGPMVDDLALPFDTACALLLQAMDFAQEMFNVDLAKDLESLSANVIALRVGRTS